MATSMFQLAEELGYEDEIRLAGFLEALIAEERAVIADTGFVPDHCPRCGPGHLVRKGHGGDGSQRWMCRA